MKIVQSMLTSCARSRAPGVNLNHTPWENHFEQRSARAVSDQVELKRKQVSRLHRIARKRAILLGSK
jgi:hypothetical protein